MIICVVIKDILSSASTTQLRWVQEWGGVGSPLVPWALDDVALGVACPQHCSGQGDCRRGICHCDQGFYGTQRDDLFFSGLLQFVLYRGAAGEHFN